jgi:hypothetical protein
MKIGPIILSALLALGVAWQRHRLSRAAWAIATIAILGLLAYGIGIAHPPDLERLIRGVGGTLGPYTYALVGALAFLVAIHRGRVQHAGAPVHSLHDGGGGALGGHVLHAGLRVLAIP